MLLIAFCHHVDVIFAPTCNTWFANSHRKKLCTKKPKHVNSIFVFISRMITIRINRLGAANEDSLFYKMWRNSVNELQVAGERIQSERILLFASLFRLFVLQKWCNDQAWSPSFRQPMFQWNLCAQMEFFDDTFNECSFLYGLWDVVLYAAAVFVVVDDDVYVRVAFLLAISAQEPIKFYQAARHAYHTNWQSIDNDGPSNQSSRSSRWWWWSCFVIQKFA